MKTTFSKDLAAGIALVLFCLAGNRDVPAQTPAPNVSPLPSETDTATAPGSVQPATLPSDIDPASPLGEIARLAQAGVDESVILSYVTNSSSLFNVDPNDIIYLQDIGVSTAVVNAMMQHDAVLKQQMATPPPPPQPTDTTSETAAPPPDETTPVDVNYFYGTLSPYGTWVQVPDYGWCWQPTVVLANGAWQPYCDHGHWVYSDSGWYWTSDYSWGWATFHYGRWFHHPRYGWCWWPDTVWGPSWVCWRQSPDYCGWAPLPPFTGYVTGIGFAYRGAAVSVGFDFGLGAGDFVFVSTANFCDPHPGRYRVPRADIVQVFDRTTVIHNYNFDAQNRTFINDGIPPRDITLVTHRDIQPVMIRDAAGLVPRGEQLGRGGRELVVARPHFAENAMSERTSGAPNFTPRFNPPPRVTPAPVFGNPGIRNGFVPNGGRPEQRNYNPAPQNGNWRMNPSLPNQPPAPNNPPPHFGDSLPDNAGPQNHFASTAGNENPRVIPAANSWQQNAVNQHTESPRGWQFQQSTSRSEQGGRGGDNFMSSASHSDPAGGSESHAGYSSPPPSPPAHSEPPAHSGESSSSSGQSHGSNNNNQKNQ